MSYLGHKEGAFWFWVGLIVLGIVTVITYRKDSISVSAGAAAIVIGAGALLWPPLQKGGLQLFRLAVLAVALVVLTALVAAGWKGADSTIITGLAMTALMLLLAHFLAGLSFWERQRKVVPEAALLSMSAENGPGKALIRVENQGPTTAVFSATAKVVDVQEQVQNPKFLRTYVLCWSSNNRDEITLNGGAAGSLLIASSDIAVERPRTPHQRNLLELRLEGFDAGQPALIDRFRWHEGDKPGAVTVTIDVTVSSPNLPSVTRRFAIASREWGGITIEECGLGKPKSAPKLSIEGKFDEKIAAYLAVQNLGAEPVQVYGLVVAPSGIVLPVERLLAQWEETSGARTILQPGELRRIVVARYREDNLREYQWNIPVFREDKGDAVVISTQWHRLNEYDPSQNAFELRVTLITDPASRPMPYNFYFSSGGVSLP